MQCNDLHQLKRWNNTLTQAPCPHISRNATTTACRAQLRHKNLKHISPLYSCVLYKLTATIDGLMMTMMIMMLMMPMKRMMHFCCPCVFVYIIPLMARDAKRPGYHHSHIITSLLSSPAFFAHMAWKEACAQQQRTLMILTLVYVRRTRARALFAGLVWLILWNVRRAEERLRTKATHRLSSD